MQKIAYPEVTSSADLRDIRQELHNKATEAATNGRACIRHFVEQLHTAVDTIDATRGATSSSVGIDWIKDNSELFSTNVDRLSRLPFFASHLDNPYITDLLDNHKLARLFDQRQLTQLARDVAKRYVLSGIEWIRCLAYQGADRDVLIELVLDRLNNNGFTAEQTDPFVEAYLVHGSGNVTMDSRWPTDDFGDPRVYIDDRSAWAAAGDDLGEILKACVKRRPDLFFKDVDGQLSLYEKLWAYKEFVNPVEFLEFAADSLTTLDDTSITLLTDLSFETRERLVRRMLPGSLVLLVDFLFSAEYLDGVGITIEPVDFANWECTAPTDRVKFCAAFRRLHWTIRAYNDADFQQYLSDGATAPETVMEALVAKMNSFGYIVSTLSEEFITGKGRRYFVDTPKGNGTIRYVHDNNAEPLSKDSAVIIDLQAPSRKLSEQVRSKRRTTIVRTIMMSAFQN